MLGFFFKGFDLIQLASISQFFSITNSPMEADKNAKTEMDGGVTATETPTRVQEQSP